jgi:hypothetical protein
MRRRAKEQRRTDFRRVGSRKRAAAKGSHVRRSLFDAAPEMPDFGGDETAAAIEAHLAGVQRFGFQGGPGVLAEVWDQEVLHDRPDRALDAIRRGVVVIRAETYL